MTAKVALLAISFLFSHTSIAATPPSFLDYQAAPFKQNPKPIKITASNKYYRTALTNLSKQALNFSGHYRFDSIGCGGGCGQGMIFNAKTGYAGLLPDSYRDCYSEKYGFKPYNFEFQANSRLLIATGHRRGEINNCEVVFYTIDDNQLKEIVKKTAWP